MAILEAKGQLSLASNGNNNSLTFDLFGAWPKFLDKGPRTLAGTISLLWCPPKSFFFSRLFKVFCEFILSWNCCFCCFTTCGGGNGMKTGIFCGLILIHVVKWIKRYHSHWLVNQQYRRNVEIVHIFTSLKFFSWSNLFCESEAWAQ